MTDQAKDSQNPMGHPNPSNQPNDNPEVLDEKLYAEAWSSFLDLPPAQRAAAKQLYQHDLYTKSLYDYGQAAWSTIEPGRPFLANWHIEAMCEHLQAVHDGRIKRLIINVPPGSGKSIWASVIWPTWSWANNPHSRWLFASYSTQYVLRDSVRRRELIRSKWYRRLWWNYHIKEDQATKHRFENTQQGFMVASSVGSGATGEHGNYLIFDDPHDRMDRFSKLKREESVNWYRTVFTSLNLGPDTRYVIIAQRITEDDMTGYALANELGYDHLCIPLFYDRSHPHANRTTSIGWHDPRTEDRQIMWPAMYTPEVVRTLKKDKSSYDLSAQYQQNPTQDEGAMFPRSSFCYFESEGAGSDDEVMLLYQRDGKTRRVMATQCQWFQCADTALETKETSAWTVVGTFAITPAPAALLVYDIARERLPVPKQYAFLIAQRRRHPRVQVQYVEKKASGHGLLQEGAMRGTVFGELKPGDKSKDMRLVPASIQYENGVVFHRVAHQAEWLFDFEHEIAGLPDTEYRDQGDVLGYAGLIFQRTWMVEAYASQSLAYAPGMTFEVDPSKIPGSGEDAPRRLTLAQQLLADRRSLNQRLRDGFGPEDD